MRVGWGHCDPAQIAYTGHLPTFALEAIDAWWEHHLDGDGWYQMELDRGTGTPFVSMNLEVRSPVTPRHRLDCEVWPSAIGTKSVTFRVDALRAASPASLSTRQSSKPALPQQIIAP